MTLQNDQPFPYVRSYWMMNQPGATSEALAGDHTADVVIVGGGYAGLSSALGLLDAKPDLSIMVLEAEHVGFGASGRNGGHFFNVPPAGLVLQALYDEQRLADTLFARELALDHVRRLITAIEEAGLDCEVEEGRVGAVARTWYAMAGVRWVADVLNRIDFESVLYEGAEVGARIGYPARGYLSMPTTLFHPYKLAQSLRTLAERRGVTVHEQSPATGIHHDADGVTVTTPSGSVRADKAVLATNAYLTQYSLSAPAKLPKTEVLHTYMIATEQLSEHQLRAISPSLEDFGDAALNFFYSRFHDRRFLFGGLDRKSEASVDDDRREASFRKLHREMIRRFPFLSDAPLCAAWGGAFQQAGGGAPVVGRAAGNERLILNIGYGDNGIAGSLVSGRIVPSLVLESTDDADASRYLSLLGSSHVPWRGVVHAGLGVFGAWARNLF